MHKDLVKVEDGVAVAHPHQCLDASVNFKKKSENGVLFLTCLWQNPLQVKIEYDKNL